jgi:hypothetical protein
MDTFSMLIEQSNERITTVACKNRLLSDEELIGTHPRITRPQRAYNLFDAAIPY